MEPLDIAQAAPRSTVCLRSPELALWVTASLTTVTVVTWVLVDTPPSTRDIALPVFVLGAGAMFGLGLVDMAARP